MNHNASKREAPHDRAAAVKDKLTNPASVCRQLGMYAGAQSVGNVTVRCPCPGHANGDAKPSLSVFLGADGTIGAHCKACGFAGDVLSLIGAVHELPTEGPPFERILAIAEGMVGSPAAAPALRSRLADEIFDRFGRRLLALAPLDAQPDVVAYLDGRRILDAARTDGWGSLPGSTDDLECLTVRLEHEFGADVVAQSGLWAGTLPRHPEFRILIPWRGPDGTITTLQQRLVGESSEKCYRNARGRPFLHPYGADLYRPGTDVMFVEGAVDAVSARLLLERAETNRVVLGLPGASNWNPAWAALAAGQTAYIGTDADPAGARPIPRMVADIKAGGASAVCRTFPEFGKDWNDTLTAEYNGVDFEVIRPVETSDARDRAPRATLLRDGQVFAPLPPVERVSVFRRGSLSLVGGYGDSGKSWLLADLMVALAVADAWLGQDVGHPGGAIYLDYENGPYELRRRLQKLTWGRGLASVSPIAIDHMAGLDMDSDEFWVVLQQYCREFDVVIIDSLRAACGVVDENDSGIRRQLDRLHAIAEETGTAIVLIAHTGKASQDQDPRKAFRGSSAIFDAVDSAFLVTRDFDDDTTTVRQAKARHGEPIAPVVVRIEDVPGGATRVTVLGRADEGGSTEPEATESPKPTKLEEKKAALLEALMSGPLGKVQLRKIVGGRKETVDQALDELVAEGAVEKKGRLYFVAGRDEPSAGGEGEVPMPMPMPDRPQGVGDSVGVGTNTSPPDDNPANDNNRQVPMPMPPASPEDVAGTGTSTEGSPPSCAPRPDSTDAGRTGVDP